MFAVQADGYEITTIEGLASAPGELGVVQDAFCETHGLQCGYCTPGMILTAHALLNRNAEPSREDIVDAISGNICRCTGYGQIVEAVEIAAERLRKANAPRNARGAHPNAPVNDPAAEHDAPQEGVLEAAEADTPHGGHR
jgi:aerobic carbon-monoxide dehydrogenase small subunit